MVRLWRGTLVAHIRGLPRDLGNGLVRWSESRIGTHSLCQDFIYDIVVAGICLFAVPVALALVMPWGRRLPRWLLGFFAWTGTGLLVVRSVASIVQGVYLIVTGQFPLEIGAIWEPWFYLGAILFSVSTRRFWRADTQSDRKEGNQMLLAEILTDRPTRIGLVLGGGGAKGAYQIGVYRALHDLGIERFECIAGTSVGSLNALLVANGKPDEASKVWSELGAILSPSRTVLLALIVYGAAYGAIFLPLICSIVFAAIYGLGTLSAHFQPPGMIELRWIDASLLCLLLSVCGVMIIGYHARTFHYFKRTLAFTFNPQIFFLVGIGVFMVLTWYLPGRTPYSLTVILALAAAASIFWSVLSLAALALSGWARRFALFNNEELKNLIERHLVTPENEWLSSKVIATVARERSFYHPAVATNVENEALKQARGELAQLGGLLTRWVPDYVNLLSLYPYERVDTLLATSAIPIAFPMFQDNRQGLWTCDGGVVDNLPVTAAVNLADCEVIVVVPLNPREMPKQTHLQDHIDEMWALAEVPKMTADEKREMWNKALEGDGQWMPRVRGRGRVGSRLIVTITPTRPLCTINLPLFRFITGTLNFNKELLKDWEKLGYDDTTQQLKLPAKGAHTKKRSFT